MEIGVDGDVWGRGRGQKGFWEKGAVNSLHGTGVEKFTSFHKWLPPQGRAFIFALITSHVLIIHYICCKFVFLLFIFSPLLVKSKPCDGGMKHVLFLGQLNC